MKRVIEATIGQGTVASYSSACGFLSAISAGRGQVAIVSYDALQPSDFSVLEILTGCFPKLKVAVLISYPSLAVMSLLRSIGVNIMLSDKDEISAILKSIFSSGDEYFSPSLRHLMRSKGVSSPPEPNRLTSMERFIIRELLVGLTPTNIALKKGISVKTVSVHKRRVMNKISIKKMSDLMLF
jgi:DNA-binding NarL/FixJ family response regulator